MFDPQVRTFDLAGDAALSSVVFHSFHLLLVTVDVAGMVRVNNGVEGTTLNAFHISNGERGVVTALGSSVTCCYTALPSSHLLVQHV
jgi:hypothetical protein